LVIYFSSKILGLMNCMMPLVKDELSDDAASWKVKTDTGNDPAEAVPDPVESAVNDPVEAVPDPDESEPAPNVAAARA
jgi:hypothetical protein